MQILTNLDLNKNQLLNTVLQQLSTTPTSPSKGQIYFSTLSNTVQVWDGTKWLDIGATPEMAMSNIPGLQGALDQKASITYVDLELIKKETPLGAQTKANTAESNAKAYTDGKVLTDVPANAKFTDTIATKTSIGLGDIDNTSDLAKPVSAATQVALDLKESIANVNTKVTTAENAAKAYADTEIAKLIGEGTSEALDTLKELAAALGNDPNFATTIMNELKSKTEQYVRTIGNGTLTSFDLSHYMGTRNVMVQVRQTGSPFAVVYTDIEMFSDDVVRIKFAQPPATDEYTVTIIGNGIGLPPLV